eukprot:gene5082-4970_t
MNALDLAITYVGGVGKLAAALGVTQPLVSNWRTRGTKPGAIYCVAIERATGRKVTRKDLRPDDWFLIWPELEGAEALISAVAPASQAQTATESVAAEVAHA